MEITGDTLLPWFSDAVEQTGFADSLGDGLASAPDGGLFDALPSEPLDPWPVALSSRYTISGDAYDAKYGIDPTRTSQYGAEFRPITSNGPTLMDNLHTLKEAATLGLFASGTTWGVLKAVATLGERALIPFAVGAGWGGLDSVLRDKPWPDVATNATFAGLEATSFAPMHGLLASRALWPAAGGLGDFATRFGVAATSEALEHDVMNDDRIDLVGVADTGFAAATLMPVGPGLAGLGRMGLPLAGQALIGMGVGGLWKAGEWTWQHAVPHPVAEWRAGAEPTWRLEPPQPALDTLPIGPADLLTDWTTWAGH